MLTLLAAVAFVLLIGCVTSANLLLARGAARQKEFAIRRALGAAGFRIARQLLTESILLALAGGTAGLLLAVWSNRLLFHVFKLNNLGSAGSSLSIQSPWTPGCSHLPLFVSCVTGILFGVAPALSALRGRCERTFKGGRPLRKNQRQEPIRGHVLGGDGGGAGAGGAVRRRADDQEHDAVAGRRSGLNPKNVLTMGMSVPQEEIYVGPPGLPRFCRDLDEHVGAVPGVVSVGAVAHFPFKETPAAVSRSKAVAANPGNMPGANYSVACPNYFRTMGIPILKGREFTQQDTLGAPGVIVINETMAHAIWPKEDPVGKPSGSAGPTDRASP